MYLTDCCTGGPENYYDSRKPEVRRGWCGPMKTVNCSFLAWNIGHLCGTPFIRRLYNCYLLLPFVSDFCAFSVALSLLLPLTLLVVSAAAGRCSDDTPQYFGCTNHT